MRIRNTIYTTLILLFYCSACQLTISKPKEPLLKDKRSLGNDLNSAITAENYNLEGRIKTTNGVSTTELEIGVSNSQGLPTDDELKIALARYIAQKVKSNLVDTSEYETYIVKFISKTKSSVITKENSVSYDFSSYELSAPNLTIGKVLTSTNYVYGGNQFTKDDSLLICVLRDYIFNDSLGYHIRIDKQNNGVFDNLLDDSIKVNLNADLLTNTVDLPAFFEEYGSGKYKYKLLKLDTIIAQSNFSLLDQ